LGFTNLRKTDLEVATNADGKARVDGLPNFPKNPPEFVVDSDTVSKVVTDDPSATCGGKFDVTVAALAVAAGGAAAGAVVRGTAGS
jgi:hypothetical protein